MNASGKMHAEECTTPTPTPYGGEDTNEQLEHRVSIAIKGLKVWTPEEKPWWRRKPTKLQTIILNNVRGCIKQGEFAAVIGPSGAGKTTFLVSLAGKCTLPSEGEVMINGVNGSAAQVAELVPQFEVMLDSLTVMEHLLFMVEMKRGSSKEHHNQLFLETVLRELKLKSLEESTIGSLSGGEKRLLSLATSLLSNPQLLICDEPTTGLDSYNASLVIATLKKLSQAGKTVICSVHQPSCHLFGEFTSIIIMANGELLFHGTQDECRDVFESINLRCPLNYNPAEHYIRTVSSHNNSYNEKIMENYRGRLAETESLVVRQTCSGSDYLGHYKLCQRSWLKQVQLILWRLTLTLKRDIRSHLFQLLVSVMVSAVVLGTCYSGSTGTSQRGVQDMRGFLWLITSEVCYSLSYSALYVFQYEIALFRREVGIYRCSAYFVARFLSFIPRCVVWPVTLVALSTFAVALPNHILTSLQFMLALMAAAVASLAYGLGMAALFTSSGIMGDVMPCADLPLFLMCGAFLRITSMPVWLYPVKFLSHFYYAMDAVSNIYWTQIGLIDCPWNSTTVCIKDGASVLVENGYSEDFLFQDGVGLLSVTLLWALLGYYGLKREERKGYAY